MERQLRLGNLSARRDWGFAGDYVRAMHLMLGQDEPEDYVVGTGVTHSRGGTGGPGVRGRRAWTGATTWSPTPRSSGPAEVDKLCADPSKAREQLGWEPKIGFDELVGMMVESDLELLGRSGATPRTRSARTPGDGAGPAGHPFRRPLRLGICSPPA